MSEELKGWVFTFTLLTGVIFVAFLMKKQKKIKASTIRKFVHIGVSFWFFIYSEYMLDINPIYLIIAISGVLFCEIYSIVSGKLEVFRWKGNNKWGTVFYLISLEILLSFTAISEINLSLEAFGAGFLAMGFGDGFAGFFGQLIKGKKIPGLKNKTIIGSLIMFFVTLFSIFLVYGNGSDYWALYLLVAFIATVLEAISPNGLDNISVPIITALFANAIL